MGLLTRKDFTRGWLPSADETNCPPSALLRADNLILDQLGSLALRQGSAHVYGPLADLDVHSLYTAVLAGTRCRFTGAGDHVYRNGTATAATFDGTDDISFTSYLGNAFYARGTVKKKHDGTTERNWGIAAPAGAPTASVLAPSNLVFASCDSTESPVLTSNEGTQSFVADRSGTVTSAAQIIANATTFRGTSTRTLASPTDYTTYSAGVLATEKDTVELYLKVDDRNKVASVTLMVDVGDGTFTGDYYTFTWTTLETRTVGPGDTVRDQIINNYNMPSYAKQQALSHMVDRQITISKLSPGVNGWNYLSCTRGEMKRVQADPTKGWTTVKAVRVSFEGPAAATVAFDAIRIVGGDNRNLNGPYKFAYAYIRDDGNYVAVSAPSPLSAEYSYVNQAARLTCANPTDTQVTHIRVFAEGGTLDTFYQATLTDTAVIAYTGNATVDVVIGDVDMLKLNTPMQSDLLPPPSNIIGISGDYYTRIFALTSDGYLWPSQRLNPDSYASGQAARVCGPSETAYWVHKALNGLYVGTSKDIYRIDGDGSENPDGTVNLRLTPIGTGNPPIDRGIAREGNAFAYIAADGWRSFTGMDSERVGGNDADVALLFRGYTRHGVSPVNMTSGRFRAAVYKGLLSAITPEGSSTTSSATVYRFSFPLSRWYRHTYPAAFRSIYREPDGTLLAGDTSGYVWQLDTGTADYTTAIPVVLWTHSDNNGSPKVRKDVQALHARLDTGGATATWGLYVDSASTAALSVTGSENGEGILDAIVNTIPAFVSIQQRITGSFSTFRLLDFELAYNDLPFPTLGQTAYTNAGYPGEKVLSGLRIRGCTKGVAVNVTPLLDGVAQTATAFTTAADDPTDLTCQFPTPATAKEIAWSSDGEIEVYDWAPVVLYTNPLPRNTWDLGNLDIGDDDMVWLHRIHIKASTPIAMSLVVYFDGIAKPAITIPVKLVERNRVKKYEIQMERGMKGSIPRLVFSVPEGYEFQPYWARVWRRATGHVTANVPILVKPQ